MIMKPFCTLTERERASLLTFMTGLSDKPPYPDLETMGKRLCAPAFDQGRSFLSFWSEEGAALGTLGIVTREIPAKGEAFLTSIYLVRERAGLLPDLLDEAYRVLVAVEAPPTTVVRLGLRETSAYLRTPALAAGFRECYRLLELRLAAPAQSRPAPELAFTPVTADNVRDFVAVHNGAFLGSPNAGQISVQEAEEAVAEAESADLMQLGYREGVPVAMFELHLEEDAGLIDGLGVHPEHQGRGYGRAGLRQAVTTLLAHGCPEVRLQVVDANANAVALYQSEGFVLDKVVATVFATTLGETGRKAAPDPGRTEGPHVAGR